MIKKISVFITDNDNLLINSLVKLFREFEEITFAGRANSGEQCLERLKGKLPDVILMDIRMEHPRAGIEAAKTILKKYSEKAPKIIFLTVSEKSEDVADAFANNLPYISKSIDIQKLIDFIKKVYHNKYTNQKPLIHLPNGKQMAIQGKEKNEDRAYIIKQIGSKGLAVICLISKGDERVEIAQKMDLSITTVHTHLRNVRSKLPEFDLRNDVKIAQFIEKYNLCEAVNLSQYDR